MLYVVNSLNIVQNLSKMVNNRNTKAVLKYKSFYEQRYLCDFVNAYNVEIVSIIPYKNLITLFYYESDTNSKDV